MTLTPSPNLSHASLHHAQRVVEKLFELGDQVLVHPLAGRVVPELGDGQVRERFLYSYRVIYAIQSERIEILAVLHGRRLLESIGERFEE
jgi:plasmid stabilization system protein ParE